MDIEAWLQAAVADAERRGLPELTPLLTALARATEALRSTDFNDPQMNELASHDFPVVNRESRITNHE